MKQLILARHAKSSWDSPSQEDFDRPLNARGLRDAPLAAERLSQLIGDEKVMMECSPAVRAKTTSLILAKPLDLADSDIIWNDSLYLCSPEHWIHIIRQWDDTWHTGITVGHNPGATAMIIHLTQEKIDNMPTCALAAIEFEIDSWSKVDWDIGKLVWLDYPKMHDT